MQEKREIHRQELGLKVTTQVFTIYVLLRGCISLSLGNTGAGFLWCMNSVVYEQVLAVLQEPVPV